MPTTRGTAVESIACLGCGALFQHIQAGKGRKPRYCSASCRAVRDKAQKATYRARRLSGQRKNKVPDRSPVMVTVICEQCGQSAVRERVHQGNRFCSIKCHNDYHWLSRKAAPVGERQCKGCGNSFQAKGTAHVYCTTECKYRVWYPKKRAQRRAQVVGDVDPIRVFDRDGWTCQICGIDTPKALRGSTEPRAPEMDHIVPLSKGGEHSYRNTQCACRKCNGSKGNRLAA